MSDIAFGAQALEPQSTVELFIDAHQHLWDASVQRYPWLSSAPAVLRRSFASDDLEAAVAGTPVTATIAVQASSSLSETRKLLETASQPGPVAAVVGWVDLSTGGAEVAEALARLAASPGRLVGIRHQAHDELDPMWLSRPTVREGVRAVADAGLSFDLLIRRRETRAALDLIEAVPNARFVIDHAAKPDLVRGEPGWTTTLKLLAEAPHVWCKVSGLLTQVGPGRFDLAAETLRRAVDIFGPSRSLFGSDWPVSTAVASYAEVVKHTQGAISGYSPEEQREITGSAALSAYAMKVDDVVKTAIERATP